MHGCRRKGYWVSARIWGDWVECFHNRPSIPNPSTESYSNGKTRVKDDQTSMEHPFFSLAKNPDTTIHHYEHNGNTITIAPSVYGMPTIWDKDILIYCCSQLIDGMKRGLEPKREVIFPTYSFLVSTNRSTGRQGYDLIIQALKRLAGVEITTNIATGGEI